MAAVAIDEDAAQAHLAERDLERPAGGVCGRVAAGGRGHAAIKAALFREKLAQTA